MPIASGPMATTGPAADYPITIGAPYRIDGVLFEPVDTLNYDEVGRVTLDAGTQGITLAHQTLPFPSYVEVTSLETGKTILARVERRGPMTASRIAALSPAAASLLEATEATPVRIRRVNALEPDRAALRQGQSASPRMDTPMSLVAVLKRKLEAAPAPTPVPAAPQRVAVAPSSAAPTAPSRPPAAGAVPELAPLPAARATQAPATAARQPAAVAAPAQVADTPQLVVQAAAFSTDARANRAATVLGGFVERSGRFYRVRTGPFANRGEAEASLAKVRAAGYSDARIVTAD